MSTADLDQARAAKARVKAIFKKAKADVVGVGIQRVADGFGLKVNLSVAAPEGARLPDAIDGVPIRVEVVGTIRKQ